MSSNSLKSKFGNILDQSVFWIIGLGELIAIGLTILAYYFQTDPSTCSDAAIITLQRWLLGFAISSTICLLYVGILTILSIRGLQIDIGFILHIVIGVIFALFFFCYHWFAYDALFVNGSSCQTTTPALWIATLVIIVMQIAAIPLGIVAIIIYRKLNKFLESIPDDTRTEV